MLLIDAFNVLHLPEALVQGRSLDLAGLADLIGTSRYAGEAAVLVCDGSGDGSIDAPRGKRGRVRLAGVEVLFSGPDSTADDEIEDRLRRGGGHGVTVVSDDRRLRKAASRVRAKSLASGTFLARLLLPRDRPDRSALPEFVRDIPLDKYSVAHWMRTFGLTPGDLVRHRGDAAAVVARPTDPQTQSPAPPKSPPLARGPDEHSRFSSPPRSAGAGAAPPEAPPQASPGDPAAPKQDLENDPVIRAALEEWRGRLRIEDLNMANWLESRSRPPHRPE